MQVGNKTTTSDLAQTLQNEQGTYYAQIGGQGFLVICAAGHSIKNIRPIGQQVIPATPNLNNDWFLEKLSNSEESFDLARQQQQQYQQGGSQQR